MEHNINVNRNRSFSRCYRSWTLEWTEKFHWSFDLNKSVSLDKINWNDKWLTRHWVPLPIDVPMPRHRLVGGFTARHSLCKHYWLWFVCLVRPYLHCQHIYTTKNIKKKNNQWSHSYILSKYLECKICIFFGSLCYFKF